MFYRRKQDPKIGSLLLPNEEIPVVVFESHIVSNVLNTRKMLIHTVVHPLYNRESLKSKELSQMSAQQKKL